MDTNSMLVLYCLPGPCVGICVGIDDGSKRLCPLTYRKQYDCNFGVVSVHNSSWSYIQIVCRMRRRSHIISYIIDAGWMHVDPTPLFFFRVCNSVSIASSFLRCSVYVCIVVFFIVIASAVASLLFVSQSLPVPVGPWFYFLFLWKMEQRYHGGENNPPMTWTPTDRQYYGPRTYWNHTCSTECVRKNPRRKEYPWTRDCANVARIGHVHGLVP